MRKKKMRKCSISVVEFTMTIKYQKEARVGPKIKKKSQVYVYRDPTLLKIPAYNWTLREIYQSEKLKLVTWLIWLVKFQRRVKFNTKNFL